MQVVRSVRAEKRQKMHETDSAAAKKESEKAISQAETHRFENENQEISNSARDRNNRTYVSTK
jgi:hypothetical protein